MYILSATRPCRVRYTRTFQIRIARVYGPDADEFAMWLDLVLAGVTFKICLCDVIMALQHSNASAPRTLTAVSNGWGVVHYSIVALHCQWAARCQISSCLHRFSQLSWAVSLLSLRHTWCMRGYVKAALLKST